MKKMTAIFFGFRISFLTLFFVVAYAFPIINVHAANWLLLQGTEPASSKAQHNVWGFIQAEYQQTRGTNLNAGSWSGKPAVFNQIRPELDSDKAFNIFRARIGLRGRLFSSNNKTNYFILGEFGNNGITHPGGYSPEITDASLTFNHLPNIKIRVGQFKTPGGEEGLQAIHVFDYINFSNVTDQLLLERFFDGDGTDTSIANDLNGPVGAFRDIGVELFSVHTNNDWENSFAIMLGNGNGISRSDNDNSKDSYIYWSSENVFAGRGPRRNGLKFYAHYQSGKRSLSAAGKGKYKRKRSGLGAIFRKDKLRASFEYVLADGMIFNGTDGGAVPGTSNNTNTSIASFNLLTNEKGAGVYLDFGYRFKEKWEADFRYDRLDRGTRISANERRFETFTLGLQYFSSKQNRLIVNYEIRDAEAPNLPQNHVANQILSAYDNKISAQWLIIY